MDQSSGDRRTFALYLLLFEDFGAPRRLWLLHIDVFRSEVYFLSQLPAEMSVGETGAVIVMALGLSLLATIYPSWRAARLDPIEGLRYA